MADLRTQRVVRQTGFTIIELLVTVVIVSILASVVIPMGELSARRAKEEELRSGLRQIRDALDAYHDEVEKGRIRKSPDESGYPPTLSILVSGVPDATREDGALIYFLRRIPRDPFAESGIPADATWGKRSYESPPDDPKEGRDVFDVYSLSDGVGLNGLPYRSW